jgi:hypothetical protein
VVTRVLLKTAHQAAYFVIVAYYLRERGRFAARKNGGPKTAVNT